jgi:hypothetical protein
MSQAEDFLSRWSRMKRESSADQPDVADKPLADALPDAAAPAEAKPDLTQLPPIGSIVAGSDVRPFLQAGVPAELTRAALRSAWSADPAICNFVGIADNQWDFNAEAAIPGFGALAAADQRLAFAAWALGNLPDAARGAPGDSATGESPASTGRDLPPGKAVGELCNGGLAPENGPEGTSSDARAVRLAGRAAEERTSHEVTSPRQTVEAVTEQDDLKDSGPAKRRSHGGALPK